MEKLLQLLDELEDLAVWVALRGARLGGYALALLIGVSPALLLIRPSSWPAVVGIVMLGIVAARERSLGERLHRFLNPPRNQHQQS